MAICLGATDFSQGERQAKRFRAAEFILTSQNQKIMELLPIELREQLPKFYEQEGTKDKIVYLKFFFPAGNWTWFVIEGEPDGDDFLFYGYVIGLETEWGYFTLHQLEEINIHGLTVERDLYFKQESFSRCLRRWKQERGG